LSHPYRIGIRLNGRGGRPRRIMPLNKQPFQTLQLAIDDSAVARRQIPVKHKQHFFVISSS
jgi:hypothetical protein